MRKNELIRLCGRYAYFDLAFLRQISGERTDTLHLNIKRWLGDGTLIPLRRGMYSLAEHLRKADLFLPKLANDLYPPSYLTDAWALSFYGLIPDVGREYTSATQRRPQTFTNRFGVFSYRHLAPTRFRGFRTVRTKEAEFRCATPEKALLDHWYWSSGEWTATRMREMRLQNLDHLDIPNLEAEVRHMGSPRLNRAYVVLRKTIAGGGVE